MKILLFGRLICHRCAESRNHHRYQLLKLLDENPGISRVNWPMPWGSGQGQLLPAGG